MRLGEISVVYDADASGLEREGQRAERSLGGVSSRARDVARRMAALGAAAAAAGAALTVHLTRKGLEAIDTQIKLARALDGTYAGLRAVQEAGEDAGIAGDQVASSLMRMNPMLVEAARGAGTAARAMGRIGLDAQELLDMDVDQRLAVMADRMYELGFSSAEAADVLRELGVSNREMALMMVEGGDAIRAARIEVEAFGLAVSDIDAAQVERANDAMRRLGRVLEVVQQQLAIALAPLLAEAADQINDMTYEAGGFQQQITDGIESALIGSAKLADVFATIHRSLVVVAESAILAGSSMQRQAALVGEAITAYPIHAVNELITLLNRLPGVDIEPRDLPEVARRYQDAAKVAEASMRLSLEAIREQFDTPLPSTAVEEAIERIRERSREMAAEASESARRAREEVGVIGLDPEAEARMEEELEARRTYLEERLGDFRKMLLTEHELEAARHEEHLEELREMLEQELMTKEEYKELERELEERHQEEMTRITLAGLTERERFERASMKTRVKTVMGELEGLTRGVAQQNRAMFELNRLAAVSNAVVNAWEGYSQSLSAYPWPLAGAMAAAHLAAGFSAVQQIKSQSFGSGGGGGGAAPSASPATPTQETMGVGQQRDPDRTITVQGLDSGALLTGDMARELIEMIEEAAGDGRTRIVVA